MNGEDQLGQNGTTAASDSGSETQPVRSGSSTTLLLAKEFGSTDDPDAVKQHERHSCFGWQSFLISKEND
jgi:hypothetical protein